MTPNRSVPARAPLSSPFSLPAILDIEASGFGAGSYPIEVGCVLPDGDAFSALIRPLPQWTRWCPKAEATHGIRREELMARGRDVADVTAELDARLDGQTVYSDGWANDYPWLHQLYDAVGRSPRFRLESLRGLLCDASAGRWASTKAAVLAHSGARRHRAQADAHLLQHTFAAVQRAGAQRAAS